MFPQRMIDHASKISDFLRSNSSLVRAGQKHTNLRNGSGDAFRLFTLGFKQVSVA